MPKSDAPEGATMPKDPTQPRALPDAERFSAIFEAAQESSALAEGVLKCLDPRTSPCNEDHDNSLIVRALVRRIECLSNATATLAMKGGEPVGGFDRALATIKEA